MAGRPNQATFAGKIDGTHGAGMKRKIFHLSEDEAARLIQRLIDILKERGEIVFAYLYGSFAEGRAFHDVDLGVYVSGIREEDSLDYALDMAHFFSTEPLTP
jgi:hypothetical protein